MGIGDPGEGSGGLPAAVAGDLSAQLTMLQPWLGENSSEQVLFAQYLGRHGGWPFGRHVFGYVTTRRVFVLHARGAKVLRVGAADLETLRALELVVPSSAVFWALCCAVLAAVIPSFGVSLLLLPFLPYLHARWSPLGLRCSGSGGDFWCVGAHRELPQLHMLFRMISDIGEGLRQQRQGLDWECPYSPVLPSSQPPVPTSPVTAPVPRTSAGTARVVPGTDAAGQRRGVGLLQQAEQRLAAGDLIGARRILDGVPAAERTLEFDLLYSRTIPAAGTELEDLQEQLQKLLTDRRFHGRERLSKRILELAPGDQRAATQLQTLRARRETLRELLQACAGKPPAAGSDQHKKLEWTLLAMDPEAEPQLAEQCRRLLGLK